MEIRLLEVAQQELDEAVEYYNTESPGLGDRFLIEALAAFERIKQFQRAWHPYTENTRRCQTHRFPYGIVYQILASLHGFRVSESGVEFPGWNHSAPV